MRDNPYGYGSGGGMIGGGQGLGGATPASNKTSGEPGGWTNIQDFLNANTGTPKVQGKIEQKGTQQLGAAATAGETARNELSAIPSTQAFTPEAFQSALAANDYNQVQSGLDNTYTPFQGLTGDDRGAQVAAGELPTMQNPFENVQPGAESIMNYFGQLERPSSQYTPGMSKMDEMLLRGQKDFVKNYPGQLNEQFQNQVRTPMEEGRTARANEYEAGATAAGAEGDKWKAGVNEYLGAQDLDYQNKYEQAGLAKQEATRLADLRQERLDNQTIRWNEDLNKVNFLDRENWIKANPKPTLEAGPLPADITAPSYSDIQQGSSSWDDYSALANMTDYDIPMGLPVHLA